MYNTVYELLYESLYESCMNHCMKHCMNHCMTHHMNHACTPLHDYSSYVNLTTLPTASLIVLMTSQWTGGHNGLVTYCSFSSDGQRLVTCTDRDNVVVIWDARTGHVKNVMKGNNMYIYINMFTYLHCNLPSFFLYFYCTLFILFCFLLMTRITIT